MRLSNSVQHHALNFLDESSRLSRCKVDFNDQNFCQEDKGHYGAYLDAMKMGERQKNLSIKDIERWLNMLKEEDLSLQIDKEKSCYELSATETLMELIGDINEKLAKNGMLTVIDLTKLMGRVFFSTKEMNRRLVRLLIHYIAVRSDRPSIIFREDEEQKIQSALGNEMLACSYFADKIREALLLGGEVWNTTTKVTNANMNYVAPDSKESEIVQWNPLDDAAHSWRENSNKST